MNPLPLRTPRLVTLALTWALAVVGSAAGLNAIINRGSPPHHRRRKHKQSPAFRDRPRCRVSTPRNRMLDLHRPHPPRLAQIFLWGLDSYSRSSNRRSCVLVDLVVCYSRSRDQIRGQRQRNRPRI
ncbi:hypothetical protein RhiJN_03920 [Ceratobasidium sp. AG-Ba]|nr:hypothetical protein RhiJN_03920 [Ceratobasidium sp. AG-Ba]